VPDESIERARAATEPPVLQPGDIVSIEHLATCTGQSRPDSGRAIKFTLDMGGTWRLGVVHGSIHSFQGGGSGFTVAMELGSRGVHFSLAVTDLEFRKWLIVRLATPEDCAGITFSYGVVPSW